MSGIIPCRAGRSRLISNVAGNLQWPAATGGSVYTYLPSAFVKGVPSVGSLVNDAGPVMWNGVQYLQVTSGGGQDNWGMAFHPNKIDITRDFRVRSRDVTAKFVSAWHRS